MNKVFYISLIFLIFITSCYEKKSTDSKTNRLEQDSIPLIKRTADAKTIKGSKADLKAIIRELDSTCLDFDDLLTEFENEDYSDKIVNRNSEEWISDMEKKDSTQFERADLLSPKCKIFENDHIISVAFVDLYDYKSALHIFTFKKPDLTPTSSFIMFLEGGDAEDFWTVNSEKVGPLKFRVVEEHGYGNSSIREGEFQIKQRETREYSIDSTTGKVSERIIKREENLIEIHK